MGLITAVNGNVIPALHVNQFANWLALGTLNDTPLLLTYNGADGYHTLNGTTAPTVSQASAGFLQITPTHNPTTAASSIKTVFINPTCTLPTNNLSGSGFRALTVRATATLNAQASGTPPAAFLADFGFNSTITVNATNGRVKTLSLDFPTIAGTGSLDTSNSATLWINTAPSGGYSIYDASSGTWRAPDGTTISTTGVAVQGTLTAHNLTANSSGTKVIGILGLNTLELDPTTATPSGTYSPDNNAGFVQLVSCVNGNVTVALPAANSALYSGYGLAFHFIKTDSSANTLTIQRSGTDTIDGATSKVISAQYKSFTLYSDGVSTWHVLAST